MTNTGTKIIETLNTDNIDVVVLANGEYPSHHIPLSLITKGLPIVCCDGAIEKLDSLGILPLMVVGDGDSIPQHLCDKYSNCWHYIPDQETNDLTKATTYCINHGFKHIAIIGADVRERKGKDRYVITRNTIGLEWSCEYDNDSVTDDSYIDRSIKTAEIALCKIRDIIKENNKHLLKRNKQLFINYVFHDKDMENSTELFNL